jgi:ABC-2 type transport system ATP-binding protein
MSGLDPLGRREVRELILRLRDRGCTVFFSSHVLSDAEALCSRVAILAKGRLAAIGSLDELTSVGSRGWELVVSGLSAETLARLKARVTKTTPLGDGRFSLELPPSTVPEQLIADLGGARIVSLNPLRGTLEDVFVEQVGAAAGGRFADKVAS